VRSYSALFALHSLEGPNAS